MVFDGQRLRTEIGVSRVNEVRPNAPITGRRYPACRLVLPPAAAIELINRNATSHLSADAGRCGETIAKNLFANPGGKCRSSVRMIARANGSLSRTTIDG
jgi:hypothetical protein